MKDEDRCQVTNDKDERCTNEIAWQLVYVNPSKRFVGPLSCICDACFSQLSPDDQLLFEPIF